MHTLNEAAHDFVLTDTLQVRCFASGLFSPSGYRECLAWKDTLSLLQDKWQDSRATQGPGPTLVSTCS